MTGGRVVGGPHTVEATVATDDAAIDLGGQRTVVKYASKERMVRCEP
ncbi:MULTISPECIES: hypothetical protein [Mycobacterium]|nr:MULTISPECIES: hypothetical protein [Mycobacterium]MCV7052104.1 hypothetical protein [Mycobacterium heidelbergense]